MSGDTEMGGWPPSGDPAPDQSRSQTGPPSQGSPELFASSSAAFGLSEPSPPRNDGFASSSWNGTESASAPTESWMAFGKGRKPSSGPSLGFGLRGSLRKQSLLASEVTLPGNQEDSQPNSHDEAEEGDEDESMAGVAADTTAIPAPTPQFPLRPVAPFRSVSASSSASSFRNAGPPFFAYTTSPNLEQRAPLERANSSSAFDDSPQARSTSSSPFSSTAPHASGSNSSASLWSTTAHLGRPGGPRRAASFSTRPQSTSGLSNSWAPSERQQTPPPVGGSMPPSSRSRVRSGSDSMSGHSHSHSPSPFFHDSSPSSLRDAATIGHQIRRPSSQPPLSGPQAAPLRKTATPPEVSNAPSLAEVVPPTRQRTSSMNSALAGRASVADFDVDIEDAQDSLDAFAMGGLSRPQHVGSSMVRTTSDSSGMVSDVSNGTGSMAVDPDEKGRLQSTNNETSTENRSNLARMVRRKPVNRADLLPRSKAHLRVAAELKADEMSPDLLSEAEVHRRLRSGPSALPPPSVPSKIPGTPHLSGTGLPPPLHTDVRPTTAGGRASGALPTPTRNRFPEQVGDEDEGMKYDDDSSGSEEDVGAIAGIPIDMGGGGGGVGSDAAFSVSWGAGFEGSDLEGAGSGKEDDDGVVSRRLKWTQFRGGSGPTNGMFVGSPGSERSLIRPDGDQEMGGVQASPSGGSALAVRPAKRKAADFESYSSVSFKRRAISPSASIAGSSCVGSPILGITLASNSNGNQPTPPPLNHISAITMPSPTMPQTHTFMSFLQQQHGASGGGSSDPSRGPSPAPSLPSTFNKTISFPGTTSATSSFGEIDRERDKTGSSDVGGAGGMRVD